MTVIDQNIHKMFVMVLVMILIQVDIREDLNSFNCVLVKVSTLSTVVVQVQL